MLAKGGAISLAVFVVAGSSSGQQVFFRAGAGGVPRAEAILRASLSEGRYQIIDRDTVLGPGRVVEGDILVLGATLRIEGQVTGDVIGVQSDIFTRPGARIGGSVAVMGGGFYGTELARLEAPPVVAAAYDYRVRKRDDGSYLIVGPGGEAEVRLVGLYGFLPPHYDRVNALTLRWGLAYRPGSRSLLPQVDGRLTFHTARTEAGGELIVWWPFGRHAWVVRGGRETRSNDEWIRSDLENSFWSVLLAMDTRAYYDARFVEGALRLEYGERARWTLELEGAWEQARSLRNRDPFSVFSIRGGFRPNTLVAEQDIASATLRMILDLWSGGRPRLQLEGAIEAADRDVVSDLSFVLFSGSLEASTEIGPGTFRVETRGQAPATDDAPPQRWRALGGWGTLPTRVPLERQGDHLWWVAAEYRVPVTRIDYFGELAPWLRYVAGNAWLEGEPEPPSVYNLGIGARLGYLEAGVFTAPDDDFDTVLVLGFGSGS